MLLERRCTAQRARSSDVDVSDPRMDNLERVKVGGLQVAAASLGLGRSWMSTPTVATILADDTLIEFRAGDALIDSAARFAELAHESVMDSAVQVSEIIATDFHSAGAEASA